MKENRTEIELSRAEMEMRKAQNILENYEEIHNRPKKQWFQSKRETTQIENQQKKDIEVLINFHFSYHI